MTRPKSKIGLAVLACAALAVAAIEGLQAQAKSKAYSVTEIQVTDPAALTVYTPLVRAAIQSAGGRNLNTAGGKVVGVVGAAAPSRVAINEWDSLDQAQAFFKSKAWLDLAPQRDKAETLVRTYVVETLPN